MTFFTEHEPQDDRVEVATPQDEFEPRMAEMFTPRDRPISIDYGDDQYAQQQQFEQESRDIQRKVFKTFVAETTGTFVFVWLGLMNVTQLVIYDANLTWTGVALGWGCSLFAGIYVAKSYSNAYLNPCIALADVIFGDLQMFALPLYILAELIGAFMASVLTYALNYDNFPKEFPCGVFATHSVVSDTQAFFIEMLATAVLSFVIFNVPSSSMKPAIISFTLCTLALTMGYQTAFSYNFARDFAPRMFAGLVDNRCFDIGYGLLIALADFAGAIFGALLSRCHNVHSDD